MRDGLELPTEIEVLESISEADRGEWDRAVELISAPIFYSYDFLSSYERHPLQNFDRALYLVARDQGGVAGLLPAYFQTKPDALGTLSKIGTKPPVLLTHVLHCYDSGLVAPRPDRRIVESFCSVLSDEARRLGAESVVFANVDRAGPLVGLLEGLGFQTTDMESRFNLELAESSSVESIFSTISGKHRRNMLRHSKRALETGASVDVMSPISGDLDDVIELFRLTAGKFEAASYYPPEHLASFLGDLGDAAMLFRVQANSELLAAATCFVDSSRFHMWAAGVRYDLTAYSPYYLLFHQMLSAAVASGKPTAEGGRGNAQFKQRYGMKPVPLVACIARVEQNSRSRHEQH